MHERVLLNNKYEIKRKMRLCRLKEIKEKESREAQESASRDGAQYGNNGTKC